METYFSISIDYVATDGVLNYPLFINSSALADRPRYIRIRTIGDETAHEELKELRNKYGQIYVRELDRELYVDFLLGEQSEFKLEDRAQAIKDLTIQHLEKVFTPSTTETKLDSLKDTIYACRDSVVYLNKVIKDCDLEKIHHLISNINFHDFYTFDHSINVCLYNMYLFKQLRPNAKEEKIIDAGLSGLLHDLGKVKIPTSLINKPGKLSHEEFSLMKEHVRFGQSMLTDIETGLKGIDVPLIKNVVYQHHENYDGSGYPEGKSGNSIDMVARMTSYADFFDAVTTKRAYHQPLPLDAALQVMEGTKGMKLDPSMFSFVANSLKNYRKELNVGDEMLVMDPAFDPCRPCEELPLKKEIVQEKNFGQVIVGGKNDLRNKLNKITKKK